MKTRTLPAILAFSSVSVFADISGEIGETVSKTQTAHNLESWWGKDVVQADVLIDFGGMIAVDGTFTFEAHGPKARYDRKDGTTIFFDGETAWVHPAEAEASRGRFHVLTWPWFIMAPFKMEGDGIQLSELEEGTFNGEPRVTLLQTFGSGVGDTPDDWYRFFINPDTGVIEEMSYIVTYGKDAETANEEPSIIRYLDYSDGSDPIISQTYEFWLWDPENQTYAADQPKATGTVSNITYLDLDEEVFAIPEGARELTLPDVD
ncbi:MAG: hypothetical protein AAGJ81_06325 [Verrucomicrobiota bacterium]